MAISLDAWAGESPSAPSRQERIDHLIEQLGDNQYAVRQQAQEELAKLGFEAFDALTVAEKNKDLEIAARARYLLRLLQTDLTTKDDPPEVIGCLDNYPSLPLSEQVQRMKRLARLPEGKGIPALCRLVRFERSGVRSKHAAIELIEQYSSEKSRPADVAKVLRENLANSRRAASRWLLLWAKYPDNPQATLAEWKAALDAERTTLDGGASDTDASIVCGLALQQVRWLAASGNKPDEVADAMRTLLRLEAADQETSWPLVDWLVQQRAWDVMHQEPGEFAEQFARDPKTLLYRVAKAYDTAGNDAMAEEAAQKALALEAGRGGNPALLHARAAYALQHEGLFKWAEREYRALIKSGGLATQFVLETHLLLAEMLHDQADDLRAAEVTIELVERLKKEPVGNENVTEELCKRYRARADFLRACHWGAVGNRAKQRELLDRALASDPTEIDVLIACYHLPDAAPEYHERIRELVKKATVRMRVEALASPDKATACNQLAWLISNTEGNCDEAIRLSRQSLAISRDNPGYLDTLARCYFAKGDLKKALEYQTKANALEPHSGQIARQLKLFRKAYEEKTGKPAPKK